MRWGEGGVVCGWCAQLGGVRSGSPTKYCAESRVRLTTGASVAMGVILCAATMLMMLSRVTALPTSYFLLPTSIMMLLSPTTMAAVWSGEMAIPEIPASLNRDQPANTYIDFILSIPVQAGKANIIELN
mgnify:CR=1 FL=1